MSRAAYDLAVRNMTYEQYRRDIDRTAYAELLAKYHAVVGTPTETPPVHTIRAPKGPSLVDQVVKEQAGDDPRLISHFRTYAAKLKRMGQTEEEIAQALMDWTTTELLANG